MTPKRFNIEFDGHQYFLIIDGVNERCLAKLDTRIDALAWLEMYKRLSEENERLREHNNKLMKQPLLFGVQTIPDTFEIMEANTQLEKENEQLKEALKELKEIGDYQAKRINELNDENEQLKQFKEDVLNKIDMHLRMLPTARDNEFNEDDGDPSLYIGAIYMLETLKKELEE